ncbi:TRAP transporter, 4TM/12TM fusion protein [Allopseudospirillum japonicum]|uniref:TRAP transporter, 4TM/12TM fusion protein n=1 Tax=Allopseudospirillum japonicum TaxID=64971 RepID=A0A1H6QIU7_9GAMM|nr:TRAP transporter permease [Allopseudospirillum japonicum]SEI39175.1 TRAP transporter, 4TM/12TM fusion protein [Allopseudospirillum japonicum]
MDNNKDNPSNTDLQDELQQMLQADSGARSPAGWSGKLLFLVPLIWSLFQLWYASPFSLLNSTKARAIHLMFAVFLAFTAYPAFKRSPQQYIPWQDWLFALLGAFSAGYLFLFYEGLAMRPGNPTDYDLIFAGIGLVLLLEATRRALGPPLMIVASVFLTYTLFGPYFPDVIAHQGASLQKLLTHQWLTTEGVFGVAVSVSASFVFLFVLFGALLEKAGAGNYFIQVAFSMLGHMRGGPAKAAVVASGLSGIISGSSIANVVTTGTFTIPLMKRVGFPGTKAGAVEVASSTNGQLTPPIMGAAAFLMVEYVGISYLEVIKHAILPALISYIALIYIVHLEAVKAGMQGLPRKQASSWTRTLFSFLTTFIILGVLTLVVYYGIGWSKAYLGSAALPVIMLVLLATYIGLVAYACHFPALAMDDPERPLDELPPLGPTVKSGLYYLLPVVVLVWCLTVERFSPGLSAFWATVFMIFIVLTQRPLLAYFRAQAQGHTLGNTWQHSLRQGVLELIEGLVTGARNMIGIGVATAAAGIVVGTVTLTGIGLVMTEFVEYISGGSVLTMLIMTAIISLILGMGLPTTANYIVVSTLMAPVIVNLGAENGLIVPLIAVHLFVFYFGILADDTPPVGLAAFAAAAIAKADPIRTGVQGFTYDIRTAILPFMFIYNTNLLLIDIHSLWELGLTILGAVSAMLIFAAATQGYWLVKNRWWETLALLLIAFTLFRPGFWWDDIYPPLNQISAQQIYQAAEQIPEGQPLRMLVEGENIDGDLVSKHILLPLEGTGSGEQRLAQAGLNLYFEGAQVKVESVEFSSPAANLGIDFDWEILYLEEESQRPAKEWMMLPAFMLLALLAWLQSRRLLANRPS